jgi:hypothetical protein
MSTQLNTRIIEISNSDDVIDVRDVIARVEELERELKPAFYECDGCNQYHPLFFSSDCRDDTNRFAAGQLDELHGSGKWEEVDEETDDTEREELSKLIELLDDLRGRGGDEEWRGDWYPITLVRDSYFKDYAQELADELDLIPSDARWPATCINWEEAADQLKVDYTTVDFDGVTYWYR